MDAPSAARVLIADDEIASGVIEKLMTLPDGADTRSRGLRVIRGQMSLGYAPGPWLVQRSSPALTATAKCARSKRSVQRCQRSIPAKASEPSRKTRGTFGRSARISASVSYVYV